MDDPVDTLLVDVRASTQGFAQDVAAMRATFDGTLVSAFERAGGVLERGLLGAIRRGSLGFEDLKRMALQVLDDIASQAVRGLFGGAGGGASSLMPRGPGGGWGGGGGCGCFDPCGGGGGILNNGGPLSLGGLLGSILGLPGRATGGPVSPGRGYLVGERGPELFVPTSAGRIEAGGGRGRDVRVSIAVTGPSPASTPQALQRSARQVASAVRRALQA